MQDTATGEREHQDAVKWARLREKDRLRKAAKLAQRKASGECAVQVWAKRKFVDMARAEGYKPVVVWAKKDAKLPDTLFLLRTEEIQNGETRGMGYIFVQGAE